MDLPKRKPVRLKDFDYSSQGAYFVTICIKYRIKLFEFETVGNGLCAVPCIQNQIVHKWIRETENKFQNIKIDKYVIMPNHIHLLVNITERHIGRSLQDAIHFFKTMTTNDYINKVKDHLLPPFQNKLWQKSYYDHIIRGENDYLKILSYIETNPLKCKDDCFYTE